MTTALAGKNGHFASISGNTTTTYQTRSWRIEISATEIDEPRG